MRISSQASIFENMMVNPYYYYADIKNQVKSAVMTQRRQKMFAAYETELLDEVYAPDAVHTARYLNKTRSYTGPEEIIAVAGMGGDVGQVGERVDFEAPEGELAWGQAADIAGGSVCIFRAVDVMITRHDCVLPISG